MDIEESKKNHEISSETQIMKDQEKVKGRVPRYASLNSLEQEKRLDMQHINRFFLEESSAYPTTISHFWLPLDTLIYEAKFNSAYCSLVNELKNTYVCWRKSRGDGNCYYRAVMCGFLLKILHPSTHISHLNHFLDILENLNCQNNYDYMIAYETTSQKLRKLAERKNADPSSIAVYKDCEKMLQDTTFDHSLIVIARLISYNTLSKRNSLIEFLKPEDIPSVLARIASMGNEAEFFEHYLLPYGLGISVRNVSLFDKIVFTTYPDEAINNSLLVSVICKLRGHYDILLHVSDMEAMNYCVSTGTYYY
ncbi:hypothetical protein SteCoe_378 [Stentor coeruleus]|uniref:ubiquitinyl hydrolase 1 n=1 Tax=Stentor coeruleus TaxID=5963 RepID=A0A1R2D440_9CILI|nr:hypothetical protein SteCoe_378 [Stentor coeruleus]